MQAGRVVEIGEGKAPTKAQELGDVALLPGLVNSHTHLEFSDCKAPIGQRGVPLAQWIGQVIQSRGDQSPESKAAAIELGIREMRQTGTRIAGEITTPPSDYRRCPAEIDLITFAEVLGLNPDRATERLDAALAHNESHADGGWSPHAPYSTSLQTIETCVELARKQQRPISMHVAESPDERELLSRAAGPLAEVLRSLGVWRETQFPWNRAPFEFLIHRLSRAPRTLLIHGNDLNDEEIACLRQYACMTVVYCPRTHHFFGYDQHPVDRMIAAGVPVALGTDSRASNPDLNLWREVQFLLKHRSDVSPAEVIRMATLSGADALGRPDLGRLESGATSALGSVETKATTTDQLYRDLSESEYLPLW